MRSKGKEEQLEDMIRTKNLKASSFNWSLEILFTSSLMAMLISLEEKVEKSSNP